MSVSNPASLGRELPSLQERDDIVTNRISSEGKAIMDLFINAIISSTHPREVLATLNSSKKKQVWEGTPARLAFSTFGSE